MSARKPVTIWVIDEGFRGAPPRLFSADAERTDKVVYPLDPSQVNYRRQIPIAECDFTRVDALARAARAHTHKIRQAQFTIDKAEKALDRLRDLQITDGGVAETPPTEPSAT